METKDNKELRVYVQPETTLVKLENEGVICGFESGISGGEEM